jgi:hypothetical protein
LSGGDQATSAVSSSNGVARTVPSSFAFCNRADDMSPLRCSTRPSASTRASPSIVSSKSLIVAP